MANIAVFASGNGSNFEAIANSFKNNRENEVKILICNRKDAYVLKRAEKFNINYKIVEYMKGERSQAEDEIIKIIKENEIDVVFLAGFMKILSKNFLEHAGVPVINIHPALLPKYKGTHAIERAYKSDDDQIGVSIHYVTEDVDSGEIILQKSIPLNRGTGLERVEEEVHRLEHEWYPTVARQICDEINRKKILT